MRIHNIELVQFGRHASLVGDLNAPVVGVLGQNGMGKSTLLQAIKYAFTGDLENTAQSYMRDGGKHGRAEVKMTFEKDGKIGKITRRITKTTTSRELEWDGRATTAAKEVDSIMRDILGADRRAVMDCVFVPQGQLTDVLFGEQAEREKQFLRMTGCAHLGTVATAAASQAAVLTADATLNVELSVQQTHESIAETTTRFRELEKNVGPDRSSDLAQWRQVQSAFVVLGEKKRQADEQRAKLEALVTALCSKWQTTSNTPELLVQTLRSLEADAAGKLANIEAAINQANAVIGANTDLLTALPKLQTAMQARTAAHLAAKNAPEDVTMQLEAARVQYRELDTMVSSITAAKAKAMAFAEAVKGAESATARIAELEQGLQVADAFLKDVQTRRDALATSPEWMRINSTITALSECVTLMGTTNKHQSECPLCLQQASWDKSVLQGRISTLKTEAAAMQAELSRMGTEAKAAATTLQEITTSLAVTRKDLDAWKITTQAGKPTHTVEECDAALATTNTKLADLKGAGTKLAAQNEERTKLLSAVAKADGAWATWSSDPRFADLLKHTTDNGERLNGDLLTARDAKAQHERNKQAVQGIKDLAVADITQVTTSDAAARAAYEEWVRANSTTGQTTEDQANQAVQQLQSYQDARQQAAAARDEVQNQLTQLQSRLVELQKLQAQYALKLRAAADMKTIAALFGRDGIAKKYLDDVYNDIMAEVGGHLTTLQSNFEIRPAEGFLAFEFRRVDEESEWMSQKQMSGGQRVKMAVAFLLALQQVVIPEVGLLVLDEPTTHLDEASRESFRDLLESMQAVLQRTECQVIVCDHCREILPALQKKVVLA